MTAVPMPAPGRQEEAHSLPAPMTTATAAPEEVKRRTGRRERRLLASWVMAVIVASGGVIAWNHVHSRGTQVTPQSGATQIAASPADNVAVCVAAVPEEPIPLATQSADDLATWIKKTGSATAKGDLAGDTDDPTCIHLYLAGRIVLIPSGTHAQILGDQGVWRRILILDGIHKGATGYTAKESVRLPSEIAG